MAKKQLDAMDRYFAEDNPENPTAQLPDDNEKKGEDNGQGSEAAGALSENDNPEGLSTVKPGEDEITGTESTEYDNVYAFLKNEKEDGDGAGEGGNGDDGDNGSEDDGDGDGKKGDDGEGTGDGEGKNCNGKGGKNRKPRKNEDTPDNPKTDLPSDNEKKGEDNGQGSEAAGALSENDDPNGLTTVKTGEDEISGTGSTEYDNAWHYFDTDGEDGDGDGEGKNGDDGDGEGSGDGDGAGDDDGKKGDDGEGTGDGEDKDCNGKGGKGKGKGKPRKNEDDGDKGSDDDGASKKDPVTGPDGDKGDDDGNKGDDDGKKGDDDGKKGDDDDTPVDDFFRVADEDEFEKPENLPGTTEAPTPVDGEGNKVDPNGNPDLPSNLTEQPLETVATPPGSTEPLANSMSRYFFG